MLPLKTTFNQPFYTSWGMAAHLDVPFIPGTDPPPASRYLMNPPMVSRYPSTYHKNDPHTRTVQNPSTSIHQPIPVHSTRNSHFTPIKTGLFYNHIPGKSSYIPVLPVSTLNMPHIPPCLLPILPQPPHKNALLSAIPPYLLHSQYSISGIHEFSGPTGP